MSGRGERARRNMEALRESFLHLTFQMSTYKRATLDEEDLVDSTGDDIYPSSPMQVNTLWLKINKRVTVSTLLLYRTQEKCIGLHRSWETTLLSCKNVLKSFYWCMGP